ncbi:PREDICTED: heparan-alpha-glucosaminide N-acetyltransferase-like [Ceratosolen solmsi marchali]|uniref:Heparan-alpha-glucosaminide N-acetyltransferase-like n=1 Tax=Ceratosolen solmsi marchali TaxID=326594 RepID=A0AAJ7DVW1_9HYME|nr:PREDICTED: heparan-alpha-glucosaminide N-acetyltransferase-like [Ceratosolen solmsi marchali]
MLNKNVSGACLDEKKLLPIDTACFSIVNKIDHPVTFFSIFDDCILCDGQPVIDLPGNSNTTLQISTKYPTRFYYNDNQTDKLYLSCMETYSFKQHGRYSWNITSNGSCSPIYVLYEPWNPYLPLLAALMIYILAFVIIFTSKLVINTVRTYLNKPMDLQGDFDRLQESESPPQMLTVSKTGMRMQALDTFRGIAVLLMIFVNNGGGKYVFLKHAAWNGLTVADLVLPWFAWAMGFTIVNSIRVHLRLSISRTRLIMKQLRRAVILIFLGLLINSIHNSSLSELRFPGVLQLLAISYFICSLIETCFTNAQRNFQFGQFGCLQDISERWAQWIVVLVIMTIHTCLIFLLRVPGCPLGYIGPGGYHHHSEYINCTAGVAGYIDRLIFGNHIYMNKINQVYGPVHPHDPEGLMNTISAVFIVFLGVQAGRIFVTYYQASSRIIRWQAWFIITGLIAGILCNFSKEGGLIPVNKNMMSLSFVLCTSSFAFLLFSILYYLIDHKKIWSGAPFIYAGANPILIYIGHYMTMDLFPFTWIIPGTPTHTSILAINLWTTTLWSFIAFILYKKDILITI